MIRTIIRRSTSKAFWKSFGLILIPEAVAILVAWLLLDGSAGGYIHTKTEQAIHISRQVASGADWSLVDRIPKHGSSTLFDSYQKKLDALSKPYFLRNEGGLYLTVVDGDEEYDLYTGVDTAMDDCGKANHWVREAYAQRKMTYTATPVSDDCGTYLAAYTPILRNGKVVGLVAAEYDSAPARDFLSIIRSAFWVSVGPAILVSLVIAYFLAFEPLDVFRKVEETAKNQRAVSLQGGKDELWDRLTPKEKEIAELARQGLRTKEIAEKLFVSPWTVSDHFKSIRRKTDWSKNDVAVQAQARRAAASAE